MTQNIPLIWKIKSHLSSFYLYNLGTYLFYFKAIMYILFTFKQPLKSIKNIRNKCYPYLLEKKDSRILKIKNKFDLSLVLKKIDHQIRFENNLMIINFNKKQLKFKHYDDLELGIFHENIYSELPVKNKIVIDIGGYVGDSALLFASLGAKKIIMIEPQPKFFKFAQENINLNNEFSNIELINSGISSSNGKFYTNYENSGTSFELKEDQQNGIEISKITLEELTSNYNTSDLVLKLDCEGCEYDILLNSSDEILKKFNAILLEFHSGFKNISQRLKNLGFSIQILNSKYTPKKQYRGHLLALK